MRIIAGTFRSRALQAPAGLATRPTTDRLRETIFNVIAPRISGAIFLDLYAGSGAVGIEALSRGASHVTFVERAPAAQKVLRKNLDSLGIAGNFTIQTGTVNSFLHKPPLGAKIFDLVFLDPPYDAAEEYAVALGQLGGAASGFIAPGGLVIAEHRRKERLAEQYSGMVRTRKLQQGDAALSFYTAQTSTNPK